MLPPRGVPRVLAVAQLTNSLGDGAYFVCSVVYFTHIVGLSPTQTGLGLTLGWGAGFLAGIPFGQLADRFGPRGTSIAVALLIAATLGAFLLVPSFPWFVLAACAYACLQTGFGITRQTLLAGLVAAEERTRTRAYLQAAGNGGMAVGAALGGLALTVGTATSYHVAFAVDALCFLIAAAVLSRLPSVAPSPRRAGGEPRLAVLRDRRYTVVAALNMVMMLYMPMLSVVVPLWIAERTHAPRWMVSAVLVVNTISVMAFQVRMARRISSLAVAARSIRWAGAVMGLACAVFALSAYGTSAWPAAAALLAGALIQVFAEMMLVSGGWELSFGLAPDGKTGQYQGFFSMGIAVARMLGPLLLTTLILNGGPAGWLVLGLAFAAAGAAMVPAVRWATVPVQAPATAAVSEPVSP
ncbi:MFS transporter [Hamadaea tsunoensis]|uniref:MFS transporter n=1 Tax=Hamadaea tsunoensis TaxID=53368 RepID=UPI001FDEBC4D|nr:MFS transporter [Hamadaea tsunoensis]